MTEPESGPQSQFGPPEDSRFKHLYPESKSNFAQYKLVLLGESAAGKSSLVLQFVKKSFNDYRESTIGAAFLTQMVVRPGTSSAKFDIWDTAGQERYKSLAPMYYRNADCALVVYDITQPNSLDKAKGWVKELQRSAPENILIALVGNKVDLVTENIDELELITPKETDGVVPGSPAKRAISTADAEQYAREAGLLFFETTARSLKKTWDLFGTLAHKMPQRESRSNPRSNQRRAGVDLRPEANQTQGPGGCNC